MSRLVVFVLFAFTLGAQEVRLTQIAGGIAAPTDIQSANDGTGRLFLVQQNGIIRIHRAGAVVSTPFLDIRTKTTGSGERGLLGLAFPPGFVNKQRFFVNYTNPAGDIVLAQYRVGSNRDVADAASETILLTITHPQFSNHNGGQIRFGPDGYLYMAVGDGGSANDPPGNGQNRNVLLGKLLRLDVEGDPGRLRIPADNPFANQANARGEIWAYGLRNPWRFSFDRASGDLWIADVGQDTWEEIDYQSASSRGGENYGWNTTEGAHCFRPASGCTMTGLVLPVAEYHQALECSVTGGFVYRGNAIPGLRGTYLYADYCSGKVWGLTRQGGSWVTRDVLSTGYAITTFGEDEAGELYLSNGGNGTIHRLDGTGSRAPVFTAASVVNAASFVPGLTPGSLATVFASGIKDQPGITGAGVLPLPAAVGGVSVTVNGVAAPIHAIANVNGQEQVNFQVPFEIRGRTSADVVVTRDGAASPAVSIPVADLQPGVYSGVLVHNADFSLVTNEKPLVAGELAFLYAAGLGAVSNQPATGAAGPGVPLAETVQRVQVTIAGIPCDVQFAGLAPGFAGVYQVNFRVPANPPSGSQDVAVTVGTATSPVIRVPVR
jgi:uncharacterized protein (TIGR03437 family)